MNLYQSYSLANNVLDNTGNYKRKANPTYSTHGFGWDSSPEECIFFMTIEQSFVLANNNFIYRDSYIFTYVTEFGDASVWTKPWS